ncbi:hypothetical protein GKE82_14020 [Conexibacter sp. W3-3-2]|uniref:HtaA domain-containing protein n=1 Tax=Conexibacter sp. W3-3-2 TaxID=2675227 RepID=UPI0012B742A9|nr:HtaA domain-containing protein [Conexibacter sp. W3-3-2]MTD45373.1 hypothetical protein [Conexibacter sp. W3-3-2]
MRARSLLPTLALVAAVPAGIPGAAHAAGTGTAAITPDGDGGAVRLTTARRLAVTAVAGGELRLAGALRLRARGAARTVTVTGLRLAVARSPLTLRGTVAGRRVTLARATPASGRPLRTDATTGAVRLDGAVLRLTAAGARALRGPLRLRRSPGTARLGRLSLAVPARPATPAPAPAQPTAPAVPTATTPVATPTPAPATTPTATATPAPTPAPGPTADPCWASRPATPVGAADWIACDPAAGGSLRSFTTYVRGSWSAAPPCVVGRAGVFPSAGASRIDDANPFDHRLTVAAVDRPADGTVRLRLAGTLEYALDAHGIDQATADPVIVLSADRRTGTVRADGRAAQGGPSSACPATPTPFTDREILELRMDEAHAVTTGPAGTTFTHVPARLTATGATTIGAGFYPAGAAYGSFTFTVPAAP